MTRGSPATEWFPIYQNLRSGKLDGLADYLRHTDGHIEASIAGYLATLIDGPAVKTGWRLKLVKHPDIGTKAFGQEQQIQRRRVVRRVARFMARAGAFDRGLVARAIHEASNQFHLSERTIKDLWQEGKDQLGLRWLASAHKERREREKQSKDKLL